VLRTRAVSLGPVWSASGAGMRHKTPGGTQRSPATDRTSASKPFCQNFGLQAGMPLACLQGTGATLIPAGLDIRAAEGQALARGSPDTEITVLPGTRHHLQKPFCSTIPDVTDKDLSSLWCRFAVTGAATGAGCDDSRRMAEQNSTHREHWLDATD